jgi:hypothetical protein
MKAAPVQSGGSRPRSVVALNPPAWFLRIALAASFFSAVADRFGFWGPAGAKNVAWGNWPTFVSYVATLNWFLPTAAIPALALIVTVLEVAIAVALLGGLWVRTSALVSGTLLTGFGLAMAVALGWKAPLDYSVFSAGAGALVLARISRDDPLSRRILRWFRSPPGSS